MDDNTKTDAMVDVTVSVNGRTGTIRIPQQDAQHICGSQGFGLRPDDRCPRCEADKQATEIARKTSLDPSFNLGFSEGDIL